MKKHIKFPLAFVNEVDNLLKDVYCKTLPREKFFLFYETIERVSAQHPEKTFRNIKARLKTQYLRTLLGRNYAKTIIDISINYGIVSSDEHYIVGKKSKDYWISIPFQNKVNKEELAIQTEVTINDNKLYQKIKKTYLRKNFDRKHWATFNMLNKIEFDEPSAIKWLSNLVNNGYFENNDTFNTHKYNVYQRMINDMVEKKWCIVEDEKTGRIFHTFNLIKRELRNFCYVDGQKLVQSDLKSSQPYFLASRLLKLYPDNENIIKFYNDVTQKDIYQVLLDYYIKLNGSNEYNYIKLIKKDGHVINRKVIIKKFNNRNDIKPEFLKIMYKGIQGGATLLKIFKTEYPSVYNVLNKIKKNNKNELPLTLQKDEARIFISSYNELKKHTWCLPVHDSIYTIENEYSLMINMLKDKFKKYNYKNYKLI